MKILIDISHPAHVHLFRNLIQKLNDHGDKVIITARDKDLTFSLLDSFDLNYHTIGKTKSGIVGKLRGIFIFTKKIVSLIKKYDIDVVLSHSSIYAALAARLSGCFSITLEDTGNKEQVYLYRPFTHLILSPENLKDNFGQKHIHYPALHESAYIIPGYFKPNSKVLTDLGLSPDEKFIIIRFVSRKSSHDIGESSLSNLDKLKIVNQLSLHAKVFISSEEDLPDELQSFSFPLPFIRMHEAMAFASLLYGESATMCSEAAFLGVPSILLDHQGRDYTDYLEDKYGLVKNFTQKNYNIDHSLNYAADLLISNKKDYFQQQRKVFLKQHISLTDFLFWLIENYPQSISQLKADPSVFDPFYELSPD
ncbi:DUF354 domain-containing protein [Bacteroidota bacterium]